MIKAINHSPFIKNVLILLTGTSFAQAIPILISPILTRFYSPEDFGLFALFVSLISILSIISTAKYDLAILLPKKNSDAKHIVFICIGFSLIFTLLLTITILFFYDYLTLIKPDIKYFDWLYLLPLGVFLLSLYQILLPYQNRKNNYKKISFSMINQSITTATVSLLAIFIIGNYWGLILGKTIGIFSSIFTLLKNTNKKLKISLVRIKYLLKRFKNFPKYSLPSDLFANLTNELPIFLFIYFYSNSVVGFYALALRVVSAPISIIGSSITNVFRKEAAEIYNKRGECIQLYKKTLFALFFIGLIPFILLAIFAPDLFEFVFGSEWRVAGEYTRVMTLMLFFKFIFSPLSYMYFIAEKLKEDLFLNVYILLSSFISIYLSYIFYYDAYYSILFYTLNWVPIYLYMGYRSYIFAKGI